MTKTEQNLVSAGVILTHCVGVKMTHMGDDGGFWAAADVDPGASSGDQGIGTSRHCDTRDCAAAELLA
jgi:hypothetical protein